MILKTLEFRYVYFVRFLSILLFFVAELHQLSSNGFITFDF